MSDPGSCASGALRADAERNRRRIVAAACELFAEAGIDASLEEVARRAGVGIATLYRRFPARSDLAAAVFVEQVWHYAAVVEGAEEHQDPWQSMVALVEGISDLQARNAGLRELLTMSFREAPEVQEALAQVQVRMERVVGRVIEAGVVRPDFDRSDLLLFMINNNPLASRSGELFDQARRRSAALFLAGVRAVPGAEPLPPAPDAARLRDALDPTRCAP